jgi:hypothetical protein
MVILPVISTVAVSGVVDDAADWIEYDNFENWGMQEEAKILT